MSRLLDRKALSYALSVIFLGLISFFVFKNLDQFSQLDVASPSFIVLLVLFLLLNLYAMGMLMEVVLRPLGIELRKIEAFGLSSLTRFCNYIAPGYLGIAVRSTYLKQTYKFKFSDFFAGLAAVNVIFYMFNALIAVVAFLYIAAIDEIASTTFIALVVVVVGLLTALFAPSKYLPGKGKIMSYLNMVVGGWHIIRRDKSVVLQASGWSLLSILSFTLMMFFEFRVFGYSVDFSQALFITVISSLNAVFAITPAGFGINEGLVVFAANLIGIPAPLALAVALLRRVVVFAVVSILSIYFSKTLLGKALFQLVQQRSRTT